MKICKIVSDLYRDYKYKLINLLEKAESESDQKTTPENFVILNNKKYYKVKTLRTLPEINNALMRRDNVIIKKIEPNYDIKKQYAVYRHKIKNTLHFKHDFRNEFVAEDLYEEVVDWSTYYPMAHESPIAAYVLPPFAKVGEEFWIEDLIEEILDHHHQLRTTRIETSLATYTGKELKLNINTENRTKETIYHAIG